MAVNVDMNGKYVEDKQKYIFALGSVAFVNRLRGV
jgi:hypothetical protein